MIYEYSSDDGRERVIERPMSDAPPLDFQEQGTIWRRKLTCVPTIVRPSGVQYQHQPIPVSRSLPRDPRDGTVVNRYGHRVREHADGTLSTMDGDRICPNREAMERHCNLSGRTHET